VLGICRILLELSFIQLYGATETPFDLFFPTPRDSGCSKRFAKFIKEQKERVANIIDYFDEDLYDEIE